MLTQERLKSVRAHYKLILMRSVEKHIMVLVMTLRRVESPIPVPEIVILLD